MGEISKTKFNFFFATTYQTNKGVNTIRRTSAPYRSHTAFVFCPLPSSLPLCSSNNLMSRSCHLTLRRAICSPEHPSSTTRKKKMRLMHEIAGASRREKNNVGVSESSCIPHAFLHVKICGSLTVSFRGSSLAWHSFDTFCVASLFPSSLRMDCSACELYSGTHDTDTD